MGFPGGASGKQLVCQCSRHKRCRFNPWVGKIPWRRAWQPTAVFLPGESLEKGAWSIGSQRIRHDWIDLTCTHTKLKVSPRFYSVLVEVFHCLWVLTTAGGFPYLNGISPACPHALLSYRSDKVTNFKWLQSRPLWGWLCFMKILGLNNKIWKEKQSHSPSSIYTFTRTFITHINMSSYAGGGVKVQ